MGTAWSEIVCNYALPIIDDVRLTDQMEDNPALFFRRMSLYVDLALPMLSRPPELYALLKTGLEKPMYDDADWVSDEESLTQETVIDTEMPGYELFSCSERQVDESGVVTATPVTDVTYDKETGEVTFPIQEETGIEYILDFYTDGEFSTDLTEAQKRLVGLAMGVVWDERFSRNWLNIQQKVHDSSFDTVNESNYMRETNSRLRENRAMLNDELRKYEQDLAYSNTLPPNPTTKFV